MSEERKYKIDFEKLEKDFSFRLTSLTHSQNNKFKLLPYTTSDKIDNTLFAKFDGVMSCFSRMICDEELKIEFNSKEFLENVSDEIGEYDSKDSRNKFKEIVASMFLKNDKLVDFSIKTINYISSVNVDEKVAKFLYSIFVDEEIKNTVKKHYNENVDNILYKIVLNALPELQDKITVKEGYKCQLPFIRELFYKDFNFLISDHELYKSSLKRFLEFYYLFYVSQLAMKLAKFEKADLNRPDKLYFSLGWESLSKNRIAYLNGWYNLKNYTQPLFSHAILLELLNHSDIEEQLNYVDLYNIFKVQDNDKINLEINKLYSEYIERRREGIDWERFKVKEYNSGNEAFNKIYELFYVIEYQFENSSRKKQRRLYREWFDKFVEGTFSKKRGALGYCLTLNEEDIILLTKLCINKEEKLKLSALFKEFEKRGIFFDRDSKIKIVQLYEKLNLIEKKSDSGDAQYVKSIL